MSKPKPFRDVQVGCLFRDIDGTTFIKTQKIYLTADGSELANCVILIPNKQKEERGDMRKKEIDSFCDMLDDTEIGEIHLIEDAKTLDDNDA